MIIEFSVGNYKSFKDPVSFSMVATRVRSKDKRLDECNVFKVDNNLRLLKSAAIYGANASGKSNFIDAIRFMQDFVLNSSKDTQSDEPILVDIFRLSTETINKPSFFEIVFLIDGRRYRYGFEVTQEKVVTEWLFHVPTIREAKLFERRDSKFEVMNGFREGKELKERTRDNALFLSVVAQFNGSISQKILKWFRNLRLISGLNDTRMYAHTTQMLDDEQQRGEILHLIKQLDVGIEDIQIRKAPFSVPVIPVIQEIQGLPESTKTQIETVNTLASNFPAELRKLYNIFDVKTTLVFTTHQKFDAEGKKAAIEFFDINRNESEGTKKVFSMAGPLVDTLRNGEILIVDELDARLHPLITYAIIGLFNSCEINQQNAQLIFATHDTNLLSKDIFRRDQIWFAEKDRFGATHLHSLAEYMVRNDASFESDYIRGKYGAIPFVGDLSSLLVSSDAE